MGIKSQVVRCVLFVGLICAFMAPSMAQAEEVNPVSPVGNWVILDPDTKEPMAVVQVKEQIVEGEPSVLSGHVITIYDKTKTRTTCEDCPEGFKNQPIIGMQVLWGLKQASEYTWIDGHLLSPKRGRVFSCNVTMTQDGQMLLLRAYTAGGVLGKTQTWYRAT